MFIVHTLDEIQGLIDAHAQFKATLGEADKEFQSIISLIKEVENFAKQYNVPGATINPYTNLTGNDIQSKWNEVKTLVPQRDETLQDELRKQQNNEALRRQFADKSNQVGPWIERQMDAVSAIGMGMQVCILTLRILKRAYLNSICQLLCLGFTDIMLIFLGIFGRPTIKIKRIRRSRLSIQTTSRRT